MCIDFYYEYFINIIPALRSWTQTLQHLLQLQTPFYLLLFMSFCGIFLYSAICPIRLICLLFHSIDFHFECVMPENWQHMQMPQCCIFHQVVFWSPTTRSSLFRILTLHLSGHATLCLDINIYWRRTIPHRRVVRRGGGSDRRPRTRGQEFCLWTVFFLSFFFNRERQWRQLGVSGL